MIANIIILALAFWGAAHLFAAALEWCFDVEGYF